MELAEFIALGGLLHDIGKPIQRCGLTTGNHSILGADFLREISKASKKEIYELLALFSEFHHQAFMDEDIIKKAISEVKPNRFGLSMDDVYRALWIVYEADNLSSLEREELESGFRSQTSLYSPFNPNLAYPLKELDLDKLEELPVPKEGVIASSRDYEKIRNKLLFELSNVDQVSVDRILPILEKYLTFVSSFTKEGNVISLYDHMRMTSAIALAMFRAGCTADDVKKGRCRKEKFFLLIEGDFSGIQDFIYSVSGKGTLKYLRARSSFLEILSWDVVLEILTRLGLTRANVIFNAGGHFLIIAQNTEEARRKLEGIRREVVRWLWESFHGKIYLAIEWISIRGDDFRRVDGRNLFFEARMKLKEKLNIRKLKRFSELEENFLGYREAAGRLEECQVCGKEEEPSKLIELKLGEEPSRVCPTCYTLFYLGEKLPKAVSLLRMPKGECRNYLKEKLDMIEGPFSVFVVIEKNKENEINRLLDCRPTHILVKNSLNPKKAPTGIKFVPYFVADYYKKIGKEGSVASFDELAGSSLGAKRLGVIKGDVDHLGLFFRNADSPSKLATISRFIDYFFKVYLNGIIKGRFNKIIREQLTNGKSLPSLSPWKSEPNIVVIYSGGDDFFIVGSWNEAFELAFMIREAFRKYTGDSLTLSVGFGIFDERIPIYRFASEISRRLEISKDEGRNRIFVIDRRAPRGFELSYKWDDYIKLWNKYGRLIYSSDEAQLTKDFRGRRNFLWKLLEIRELYVTNPMSTRWAYLAGYHLARNFSNKDHIMQTFSKLAMIYSNALKQKKPQPIYWIDGVLKIILLATRG